MKHIAMILLLCFQLSVSGAAKEEKNLVELKQLKSEAYKNLTENILPYWTKNMVDPVNGGFYGRIDFQEKKYPDTDKGGILNARILWTFSSAYRLTKDTAYLITAKRAKDYILKYFIDQKYGGTYRSVNSNGQPSDLRKQTYSQSFFKILDPKTFHLRVFLTGDWQNNSTIHSYGHDIEASWLLVEAAHILGDKNLIRKVEELSPKIAKAASEGLQPDGSLINEKDYATGHTNTSRDWWPQAEAVVGLVNAWELSGNEQFLNAAINCWNFTSKYLVDHQYGEWFNAVSASGTISKGDKAGFWKCPYHNGRMCMEIIRRVSE